MADQVTRVLRRSWTVPAGEEQIRLDAFARRCLPHLSRREIDNAIRDRLFLINGKWRKRGDPLHVADTVVFHGPEAWLAENPIPDASLDVPVIYEDSELLVLDKPAGMATHGFSGRDETTLANFIMAQRPELMQVGKIRWEPGIVHRLDRETSGLVLVAKTQAAFVSLKQQFRRRQVKKTYLALVWGNTETQGLIDYPLVHASRDQRRMSAIVSPSQQKKQPTWKAVTRYQKLATAHGLSLLEIDMETGVTHQIRVHLATIGHPIVADALYGNARSRSFGLQRHFLHAWRIKFYHPTDRRTLEAEADLPTELRDVLKRLELNF